MGTSERSHKTRGKPFLMEGFVLTKKLRLCDENEHHIKKLTLSIKHREMRMSPNGTRPLYLNFLVKFDKLSIYDSSPGLIVAVEPSRQVEK